MSLQQMLAWRPTSEDANQEFQDSAAPKSRFRSFDTSKVLLKRQFWSCFGFGGHVLLELQCVLRLFRLLGELWMSLEMREPARIQFP